MSVWVASTAMLEQRGAQVEVRNSLNFFGFVFMMVSMSSDYCFDAVNDSSNAAPLLPLTRQSRLW